MVAYMVEDLNMPGDKYCVCPGTLYANCKCIINRHYSIFKIKNHSIDFEAKLGIICNGDGDCGTGLKCQTSISNKYCIRKWF